MREKFESIKNGCPWIEITEDTSCCRALFSNDLSADTTCHYKNCAVLYWLRHLTNTAPGSESQQLCLCPLHFGDCVYCDEGECCSPLI